jgi:SAM-dependent methyltransferase
MSAPNAYSRRWFDTFLGRIDPSIVEREVAFLRRHLGSSHRVLDLCCGPGRHAAPLALNGYRVLGLDRDDAAVREAAVRARSAVFVRGDMLRIPLAAGSVDAVICMWQSFGHLEAIQNAEALAEMARVLRPAGRLVIDLYHRAFHEAHLGERLIERDGARVYERRSTVGGRLRVELSYEPVGEQDVFDWLLYTPNELAALGAERGLALQLACTEFDEAVTASGEHPRMQLVFRRTGGQEPGDLRVTG